MKTRRQFMGGAIGYFIWTGLWLSPGFSLLRSAFAKTKKAVLPKGTKREDLVGRNPSEVDARDLEVTPLNEFGSMGLSDHVADIQNWRLRVSGRVGTPLSLSYGDLLSLPPVERNVLLICPGVFANHGRWKGFSVSELLNNAGTPADVTHAVFSGPEGPYMHSQIYPIEELLSGKVFLAYGVNGETLPRKYGYPLRVVADGYYGFDWIKYVDKIAVRSVEGGQ